MKLAQSFLSWAQIQSFAPSFLVCSSRLPVPQLFPGHLGQSPLSDHSRCFSQQPRLPSAGSLQGAWTDLSASADLVPAVAGILGWLRKLELAVFPNLRAFEYPGKCYRVTKTNGLPSGGAEPSGELNKCDDPKEGGVGPT